MNQRAYDAGFRQGVVVGKGWKTPEDRVSYLAGVMAALSPFTGSAEEVREIKRQVELLNQENEI